VSGSAYLIGSLVVIAAATVAQTLPFEGAAKGVFRVPRIDSEAWTEGEKIYFDPDASPDPVFTNVAGSPTLTLVGVSLEEIAASPATATGLVRLDGAAR